MRILRRLLVGIVALAALLVGGLAAVAYLVDIQGLIDRYKPVALETASKALNRDVELAAVEPTWFPTLGLRLEGIGIGDQPLRPVEGRPEGGAALAKLDAIQVGVAVWPALTSLGRDIQVTEIRIERPEFNVVRYADGRFNFSDIGTSSTATESPPPPEPASTEPGFADRLTTASVGEIVIVDGMIRYEDRTEGGVGVIDVRRLGLQTGPVGLGLPVKAELTAALKGGEEPNLRIELATGALAERVAELGAPEVEQVILHARGVPLSLVPVDVPSVALADAALTADVELEPGARGALAIRGPLSVSNLRLRQAGTTPGAAFDVGLDLAVATSTAFTSFGIDGTKIAVGPLSTSVGGRVSVAPSVRWKAARLDTTAPFSVRQLVALLPGPKQPVPAGRLALDLDSTGDPDRLTARLEAKWSGLEYVQEGLTAMGDVGLEVSASGATATPKVDLELDATSMDVKGEGYAKPAGLATLLESKLDVGARKLTIQALELVVGAAKLSGAGQYPMSGDGMVEVALELPPLDLASFLGSLSIPADGLPPGSRVGLAASYQASAAKPADGALSVSRLDFSAGQSKFSATAEVERFDPLVARLDGRSPVLDLDTLLPQSEAAPADAPAPAPAPAPSDEPLLPPSMKAARVTVDLEVARLIYQGVAMSDVDVLLLIKDGKLEVQKTQVGLLGGRIAADGTKLDLAASPLRYDLAASLAGLQGSSVMEQFLDLGEALSGQLDSKLTLSGRGLDAATAIQSLTGAFELALSDGRLDGVDLVSATVLPLREALDFASSKQSLGLSDKTVTQFKRLAGRFQVDDGRVRAKGPIVLKTPRGDITLDGSMGLDGKLDFTGSMGVPPKLVAKLTGGKVRPKEALPVAFGLGCTITEPCVEGVDVKPAAEAIAKLFAGKALDAATNELSKRTGVDASKAKKAAEAALKDAEAAKAKLEAEAKKKAEEAKRRAEAEARRRVEEAKRRAEAEAKKKAEEAAKKAKNKLKGLFGR